jgi:protein-S-isoprenylcysteine O-methyltransferase Ste14
MTIYNWFISGLWLALIAYWAIAAGSANRSIGGARAWWREIGLSLGVLFLILLAWRISVFIHAWRNPWLHAVNTSLLSGLVGSAFCALGVGLAIAARVRLGQNWGMPMSRKENPELVSTGPYALVRHPIYAGILLAMLGSTIGQSIFWLQPLILFGIYFIYSARREEKLLTEQFPEQYPAYMHKTKMLVPFLL